MLITGNCRYETKMKPVGHLTRDTTKIWTSWKNLKLCFERQTVKRMPRNIKSVSLHVIGVRTLRHFQWSNKDIWTQTKTVQSKEFCYKTNGLREKLCFYKGFNDEKSEHLFQTSYAVQQLEGHRSKSIVNSVLWLRKVLNQTTSPFSIYIFQPVFYVYTVL